MDIHRKFSVRLAGVAALAVLLVFGCTSEDDLVKKDLFSVITLQGQPCGMVLSYERLAENDYYANCRTGDRYRVYIEAESQVQIERQTGTPVVTHDDHEEIVKRDLFAIITLTRQPCDHIVSFKRWGENEYHVECQTGDRYRVYVVPEGRVKVERQ
ncbi:MAG: hypothetical protein V3U60_05885 [Gammaproteobacteria bacterium]